MHDLTAGTEFAAGSEVACHPSLAQPNFVFRNMVPVAIIDWDGTKPGSRRDNLCDFLWAFVYPALYGDGEPAAAMVEAALDGYAWTGPGIVEAMLTAVRGSVDRYDTDAWAGTSSPTWSGTPTSSTGASAADTRRRGTAT